MRNKSSHRLIHCGAAALAILFVAAFSGSAFADTAPPAPAPAPVAAPAVAPAPAPQPPAQPIAPQPAPQPAKKEGEEGEPKPGEYDPNFPKPGEPRRDVPTNAKAPGIFARAGALLKDRGDLIAQISQHAATIASLNSTVSAKDLEIGSMRAELTELRNGAAALEANLDALAGRKAVDIAAAQGGVPPIPTAPVSAHTTTADAIASLREQATNESDPIKRAQLHAKADRLADQRENAGNS